MRARPKSWRVKPCGKDWPTPVERERRSPVAIGDADPSPYAACVVELISDEGRRALGYLDMVEKQGARPTVAQLDTYADLTRPRWVPDDWADDGDYVSRNIQW